MFWYNAVLKSLPELRGSVALPGGGFLNNRGLFLPRPQFARGFRRTSSPRSLFGIVAAIGLHLVGAPPPGPHRAADAHALDGRRPGLSALPLVFLSLAGSPLSFSFPAMGRFNVSGGMEILPEFAALLLALSIYTAAFIAEVVRAGVLAVSQGQTEAAQALGLRSGTTLRLIVMPQAMRVIVPPLTSQYLNLIKNSSLAVAIGYPDLVQVFTGSVLNITGQAVEVVAITMAVYLTISLVTSLLMNLYGRAIASRSAERWPPSAKRNPICARRRWNRCRRR